MKYKEPEIFVGFIVGFLTGAIFSIILIWTTAVNPMCFGLECANRVLNNPKMSIDTTYTICRQDTTVTYHFIKDK